MTNGHKRMLDTIARQKASGIFPGNDFSQTERFIECEKIANERGCGLKEAVVIFNARCQATADAVEEIA